MTHGENSSNISVTPWRVRGLSRGRRLVSEFNELFLIHLAVVSGADHPEGLGLLRQAPFGLLVGNTSAIKAIAAAPYLLGDFGFGDTPMWSSWVENRSAPRLLRSHRGVLPTPVASLLARRALTTAWMMCEQEPRQAPLFAGMSATMARRLATLSLDEVERIAQTHMHALRPRWEESPARWTAIINAATLGDQDALHRLLVHGLQLLAGARLKATAHDNTPAREQPGSALPAAAVHGTSLKRGDRGPTAVVLVHGQDIQPIPLRTDQAQAP